MQKLVIEDDQGHTTVVPLLRGEITVGRNEGNTIRLTERNVSRRHARILRQETTALLEDLDSYNGVKVNGVRVEGRVPLKEGDRIQIGDYQIALRGDEAIAPAPVPEGDAAGLPPLDGPPTQRIAAADVAGAQAEAAAVETSFKLIGVGFPVGGREFALSKPVLVIGRDAGNDVVLNHPSVASRHARLVRRGAAYALVDLESSGGTRINGQPAKDSELAKGDVIEFGEVRLRFADASEPAVAQRESGPSAGAAKKASLSPMLIAAIFAGVALVAWQLGVFGGETGRAPSGTSAPVEPTAPEPAHDVSALIAQVQDAFKSEDWARVVALCDEVLAADPENGACKAGRGRAESERAAKAAYDAFQGAVARKDSEAAVARWSEIPNGSLYQVRGEADYEAVRAAYVEATLEKMKAAAGAGRCDDVRQLRDQIAVVDENNARAAEIWQKCEKPAAAVAAAPAPAPSPSPEPEAKARRSSQGSQRTSAPAPGRAPKPAAPVVEAPPAPEAAGQQVAAPASPSGADEKLGPLLAETEAAYVRGDYDAAIASARQALKLQPGNGKAWRIIGVSSCYLKNRDDALEAYQRVSESNRPLLTYVCQQNGLKLP